MTNPTLRADMQSFWERVDREADAAKDSQSAQGELLRYVNDLPKADRAAGEQIIVEWLRSTDDRQSFDALHVVYALNLTAALPVLRSLADECEIRTDAAAPYDWAQYNRAIGHLTSAG